MTLARNGPLYALLIVAGFPAFACLVGEIANGIRKWWAFRRLDRHLSRRGPHLPATWEPSDVRKVRARLADMQDTKAAARAARANG